MVFSKGLVVKNVQIEATVFPIAAVRTSNDSVTAPLDATRPRSVKSFNFSSSDNLAVIMALRSFAAVFASVANASCPSAVVDITLFNNASLFVTDRPASTIAAFTLDAVNDSTAACSPIIAAIFDVIADFNAVHVAGKNILPSLNAEIVINIEGIKPRVSTSLIKAVPMLTIFLIMKYLM